MPNEGTGKSTLVQYIIRALNIPSEQIAYVAYTGKASLILHRKGCPGATTAHRLLYHTKELPDGTFKHTPKLVPPENLKLIVVDEISMLEKEQWEILMDWDIPVICLGDPFQLPPIHEDNGILNHPHVFLDEIMRQAQESEIVRLSMDIREGKYLNYYKGSDVKVVSKDKISNNILITANQVLCGKNVTRYDLNRRIRQAIWQDKFADAPIEGDKIICLKNYWDYGDLINGMIGTISNINTRNTRYLKPQMIATFQSDDIFTNLNMDYKIFTEGTTTVTRENWRQYPKKERPLEFDFAYAITTHKAQGSEFPRVVVFDEWIGDRLTHQRWLYTACTRASDKLIIGI